MDSKYHGYRRYSIVFPVESVSVSTMGMTLTEGVSILEIIQIHLHTSDETFK